jgi:hypothetical protein
MNEWARANKGKMTEDKKHYFKWILSACRNGHNLFQYISKFLARRLDVNAPSSNAFAKMYELCYEPEVEEKLRSFANAGTPLRVICLAEAPGTFPISIMYWLTNRFPVYMAQGKYDYHCTTLQPPEKGTEGEALGDVYDLISLGPSKWTFMDHTSSKDTRMMIKKLGANKNPFVTGDIGLSPDSWKSSESDLFRVDLGQFIAACCLLEEGGIAVLKGFMFGAKASLGIIRLAMVFFESPRLVKPRTSRMNNNEMYLVLSGFHVKKFEPYIEDLLRLMDESEAIAKLFSTKDNEYAVGEKPFPHYPSFLPEASFTDSVSDVFYRYMMSSYYHRVHTDWIATECFRKHVNYVGEPYEIQKKVVANLLPSTTLYLEDWLAHFRVAALGEPFHRMTGISKKRKPPTLPDWIKTRAVAVDVGEEVEDSFVERGEDGKREKEKEKEKE